MDAQGGAQGTGKLLWASVWGGVCDGAGGVSVSQPPWDPSNRPQGPSELPHGPCELQTRRTPSTLSLPPHKVSGGEAAALVRALYSWSVVQTLVVPTGVPRQQVCLW